MTIALWLLHAATMIYYAHCFRSSSLIGAEKLAERALQLALEGGDENFALAGHLVRHQRGKRDVID